MENAKTRCSKAVLLLTVSILLLVPSLTCAHSHFSNITEEAEECHKVLNSSLETLYSPDYPNASPLSRKCTWQLNAEPNRFIAIQLMEMNVGGSDLDCTKGYLEIYDGCGQDSFLVDKICTSRYQNDRRYLWVSTGSCVVIKFNSAGGTKNRFYLKTRQTSFSCNHVLHNQPNGTFFNLGSRPLEKQECTWVLSVPRNRIALNFVGDFHIQRNKAECKDDLLTVQNGKFSSSRFLGTFCGHTRPYPVHSTTPSMRITLKTSGRSSGATNTFKAVYKMEDMYENPSSVPHNCGPPIMMNAPHGSLKSPGYPHQYPPHRKCVWLIQVKPELKILLRFKDFDVGDDSECTDYVEIFDGLASWSLLKGHYCGRNIPPVFRSSTNKLRLVFTSNGRYAGRGFDAVYSDFDSNEAKSSSRRSHFTGIMIGTTCGIIFIVLSVLAVFHARKRRLRRAMEQRSEMASTISFDIHQANAPPSYETVMASPNLFPTPKGESDLNRAYEGVPSLHHEVCHLLGSNPDSDDEEPPPTYHGLFGDEGDVQAYGPIDGHFTVKYHRHAPQGDQAEGVSDEAEKPECESKPGRVWQRRDYDHSRSSIHLPGSRTETLERQPKETDTRPTLERQDTCSSFVTDV